MRSISYVHQCDIHQGRLKPPSMTKASSMDIEKNNLPASITHATHRSSKESGVPQYPEIFPCELARRITGKYIWEVSDYCYLAKLGMSRFRKPQWKDSMEISVLNKPHPSSIRVNFTLFFTNTCPSRPKYREQNNLHP